MLIRPNCCEECRGSAPRRPVPIVPTSLHFGRNWIELVPIHHGSGWRRRPPSQRFGGRATRHTRTMTFLLVGAGQNQALSPTDHEMNVYPPPPPESWPEEISSFDSSHFSLTDVVNNNWRSLGDRFSSGHTACLIFLQFRETNTLFPPWIQFHMIVHPKATHL